MKQYQEIDPSTVCDPEMNIFIPKDDGNRDWRRVQREVEAGEAKVVPTK